MTQLTIARLPPSSVEQQVCAAWRHEAFLQHDGFSLADSYDQLQKITTQNGDLEVALLARMGAEAAGICLLVRHELEPAHNLTPWLASLFVAPEYRGQGVATRLIGAIEDHARAQGVSRLHLYTVEAKALYLKCGWSIHQQFESGGIAQFLMTKDL